MINYNSSKSGRLITELREKRNLSMQDVASKIGVSKTSVFKWENALSKITPNNALKIAKFFNITVEELLLGKQKDEPNLEYIKRNYDLDLFNNFTSDNLIENPTPAIVYYNHIKEIRNEFYRLLPKYTSNTLSAEDEEEFAYISKYFKFDLHYYWNYYPKERVSIFKQKNFINETIKKYKNTPSYDYEISKLYDMQIDLKWDVIYESESLEVYEAYLSILTQPQLDFFLLENLAEDIESNPYVKYMIEVGVNVLYQYTDFNLDNYDEEYFAKFEGDKSINKPLTISALFARQNKIYISNSNEDFLTKIWKTLSIEQYNLLINHKKTQQLRDILKYKESEPLKYYNKQLDIDLNL